MINFKILLITKQDLKKINTAKQQRTKPAKDKSFYVYLKPAMFRSKEKIKKMTVLSLLDP